ncbi:MAG: hypothetical protein EPN47_07415 [Acidobacteria bacterium]|nr:MAG: hypothetical protein EPN47_07415 [Acidobacteriota bacterium]
MSILAGFDAVIELSRGILLDQIRQISIGGNALDAPTEIQFGDTSLGADVIILDPIQVTLTPGTNQITITIAFDDSTVYYKAQTIRPLKGMLTLSGTIDVVVVDSSSNLNDIGLVLPASGVLLAWDSGAYTQAALGQLSLSDRASLDAGIPLMVSSILASNSPRAHLNFNTDNSRNGLLGTSGLRFRSVTVQNIDANTIGVFCVALLQTQAPASINRTEPGLVGGTGACVSLSPNAFQQLVFCPGVASSLMSKFDPKTETADQYAALVNSNMPPLCGSGQYVPLQQALKLVQLQTALQNGSIQLTGRAVRGLAGDVYCFRAVADFSSNLYLSVVNGAVQFKMNPDPPTIDAHLDVSWFCILLYFVAAVLASPITAAITIVLLSVAEFLTNVIAPMLVTKPLNINQTEQVGLSAFALKSVSVLTERLTLFGIVPSSPPSENAQRSVGLQVAKEEETNEIQIGSGVYHYPGSMVCKAKDYHYVEYTYEDVITLSATAHLMGTAPRFNWTIEGVPLMAASGTLNVKVPATIPQPGDLPGKDTGSLGVQSTTVDYVLADSTTLVLTGHGGFNFSVNVAVECQSLTGFTSSDNLFATFTNCVIKMADNYDADMAACALASRLVIGRLRTSPQGVPMGGDPPNYGEAVEILRQAISENKVGAMEALITGSRVFGSRIFNDVLAGLGARTHEA